MANEQNLRTPTSEEAREIGRKGGIASGEARRKRKTLAEIGDMIGGLKVTSEKNREIMRQAGIEDEEMINDTGMLFRLNLNAQKGDPKAIELLSKLRGQFKEQHTVEKIEPPAPLYDARKKKK